MKTFLFKNINLMMTDRDRSVLEKLLSDPAHQELNLDLGKALETDEDGKIIFFMPSTGMKWSLIFYLQNLMIMQRLNAVDQFLAKERDEQQDR